MTWHPFARTPAPPTPAGRGCLAALAFAGAAAFAGLAGWGFLATTYAAAHRPLAGRASRIPAPIAGPAADLKAARQRWGAIRAAYRLKHPMVPA